MSILDFDAQLPMDMRAVSIMQAADTFLKACGRVRLSIAGEGPSVIEGVVQSVSLDGVVSLLTDEGETATVATNQVINVLVLKESP